MSSGVTGGVQVARVHCRARRDPRTDATAGTSRGFTLIELLIVVVIMGILAAIAIPKFASSKEKAMLTALKSDLRNLATQQESYSVAHSTYTTSLPATLYTVTTGVTSPTIALTAHGLDGIRWSHGDVEDVRDLHRYDPACPGGGRGRPALHSLR